MDGHLGQPRFSPLTCRVGSIRNDVGRCCDHAEEIMRTWCGIRAAPRRCPGSWRGSIGRFRFQRKPAKRATFPRLVGPCKLPRQLVDVRLLPIRANASSKRCRSVVGGGGRVGGGSVAVEGTVAVVDGVLMEACARCGLRESIASLCMSLPASARRREPTPAPSIMLAIAVHDSASRLWSRLLPQDDGDPQAAAGRGHRNRHHHRHRGVRPVVQQHYTCDTVANAVNCWDVLNPRLQHVMQSKPAEAAAAKPPPNPPPPPPPPPPPSPEPTPPARSRRRGERVAAERALKAWSAEATAAQASSAAARSALRHRRRHRFSHRHGRRHRSTYSLYAASRAFVGPAPPPPRTSTFMNLISSSVRLRVKRAHADLFTKMALSQVDDDEEVYEGGGGGGGGRRGGGGA